MMTFASVTLGGAAQAADLPRKAPPPVAPPPFSWTGFYIGAHVGAGWGTVESEVPLSQFERMRDLVSEFDDGGISLGVFPVSSHTINGILGGGQVGFNYQIAPWLVFGVEGQFSASDISGSTPCILVFKCTTDVNWLATVAGRIGSTHDRLMLYVKGGAAWADSDYFFDFAPIGPVNILNASDTRFGYMLGAGVEYAFYGNWSAKLEYNFLDFGTDTIGFGNEHFCCIDVDITQKIHLVKFGINYRLWGGAAPVAARY
jgi:outer membrane immunogenic protein